MTSPRWIELHVRSDNAEFACALRECQNTHVKHETVYGFDTGRELLGYTFWPFQCVLMPSDLSLYTYIY